jgi:AraC-like DNA-binding protein
VCLEDGDIIVYPHGAPHSLTHRPGTRAIPVGELQEYVHGFPPTLEWGGAGERGEALCGFFQTDGRLFNPLVDALPEVLVVRRDDEGSPWLAATLERTFSETLTERPGGAALVGRLTELLFVDVVQRYLEQGGGGRGLLAGLGDAVVAAALALIHRSPERHWSLEELAAAVGASRSMLTERFTELLGLSPIRYLTAWRMELAGQRLLGSADPIAEIAAAAGYESEAAFNRAFKRHAGEPPATWRRRLRAAAAPVGRAQVPAP